MAQTTNKSAQKAGPSPSRRARLPAAERRQQIIDSARRVFAANGISGTGIRDLAEGAGIDTALLYHYFDSKEAIFEAAVLEPLQEMVAHIEVLGQRMQSEAPADRVREVEEGLLHMVKLVKDVLPLLGLVLFGSEDSGRRFFKEHLYPVLCQSYEAGLTGLADWVERPTHPAMVTAIFGMCLGIAMQHHFLDVDLDEAEMGEVLRNFVLYGLSAPVV
jgi:AcrR family transcriptional regulator